MNETRSYQPIQIHHVAIKDYASEWVELYDRLPTGRALQLNDMRNAGATEDALSMATIAVLVKAWSLAAWDGAPLPTTIESFNELDIDMTRAIAETAQAHCSFLASASPASPTTTAS